MKEKEDLINQNSELLAEKASYSANLKTIESELQQAESDKTALQDKNGVLVTHNNTLKLDVERGKLTSDSRFRGTLLTITSHPEL